MIGRLGDGRPIDQEQLLCVLETNYAMPPPSLYTPWILNQELEDGIIITPPEIFLIL